jgi:hypothetical protein
MRRCGLSTWLTIQATGKRKAMDPGTHMIVPLLSGRRSPRSAIDLWGLAAILPGAAPEANDAVGEQPAYDDEDDGANTQDKPGQVMDSERWGGGRDEDIRRLDHRFVAE